MDDFWHPVLREKDLRRQPQRVLLQGQALVLFRTPDGIACLRDMCPHRAASLSRGTVRGDTIECPYHGWRFNGAGHCTHIPLLEGPLPRRAVPHWAVQVSHGLIFVCRDPAKAPPLIAPVWDDQPMVRRVIAHQAITTLVDAVENVLDPIHTLFVHKGLIRGGGKTATRVTLQAGIEDGALTMRYAGEAQQDGLLSRLLERPRSHAVSRFWRPGVVSLEYWGAERLNLVTTLYFTQEDGLRFKGFAVMTGPRQGGLGYLKAAVFLLIMRRVIAQDIAIMRDAAENWQAAGQPPHATSPLDLLRPLIEAVARGDVENAPTQELTLSL